MMAKIFNVPAGRISRNDHCLPLTYSGSGFHPAKIPCEVFKVVQNVQVEKLISITFGDQRVSDLPEDKNAKDYHFNNCLSKDYEYKETVKYNTTEELSFSTAQVYTNVSNFKSSFDVNASFFKLVGGKYGEGLSETVTFSLTSNEGFKKIISIGIEQPFAISIPAKTRYTFVASDEKKTIVVPVTITAVLTAQLVEQTRDLSGKSAQDIVLKTFNDSETESLRTITVPGSLYYRGSSRTLNITLKEKALTEADCQ